MPVRHNGCVTDAGYIPDIFNPSDLNYTYKEIPQCSNESKGLNLFMNPGKASIPQLATTGLGVSSPYNAL